MLPLPDGRVLLRWMFVSLGLILLFGHEFVVHSVLRAEHWAGVLFPHNMAFYAFFMSGVYFYLIPTPLLCLATASGLKRNKRWARWTGASASCLLLLGFPVLSVFGVVGLYALFAKPPAPTSQAPVGPRPPAKATTDFWASRRESKAQPLISGITMFFGFQAIALLCLSAQRSGLPPWNPGWKWWVYLFVFLLLQTAIHELGHAGMAWTLFFRVRVISVGPFTFWNDGYGYQFRFDWKRLLNSSGYMGAVPANDDQLLLKQLAIIAAGPMVELVLGLLLLMAFFALPGTGWEQWWWVVAFNAVLGVCCAITSLLPFGYSDGAMLYHLLRGTPAGQQLFNSFKLSLVQQQADDCHERAEFDKEVEVRGEALRGALEGGEQNAMAIALCRQSLGHAKLACEDWLGAEAEFRKCLEFEAECALNPPLRANSWSGLQKACAERHWVFEAERAAAAAARVIEERKKNRNRTGLAVAGTMLAQVHLRAGEYDAALAEARDALSVLPQHRSRLMLRAMLHSVEAQAHTSLGAVDHGMEAARECAAILRSREMPEASRNEAFDELGELGEGLWKAGQSEVAIDLIREAIEQLESGGAAVTAAQYRIKLAAAVRELGRQAEALYILPDESMLPAGPLRCLLAERAELHLAAGQPGEASVDCRRLLALWQAEPGPPAAEVAMAEGLLARACLEAGDASESEALARHAAEVLTQWGHPDAATCRITLALATREPSVAVFEDALRLIRSDSLLSPAEKTRRLEFENGRIGRSGPVEGTANWESEAPAVCQIS